MNQAGTNAPERRTDERHDVDLAATIRAYQMPPFGARVRDLSFSGAMIASDNEELRRGTEILLAVGGIELVATVAWVTDDFRGIVFHRRLSGGELASLRRLGRARG